MRACRLSLLVAAALSVAASPCAAAAFDPAPWRQDYAQLKQALEREYANLAWFASPQGGVDLPALDRATVRALDGAENDAQAERALRDFVAGFGDGHFSFVPSLQPPAAEPVAAPPPADARRLDPAAGCAALGYDGGDARVPFSLPFESLPGFRLLDDGIAGPFRSGLMVTAQGTRIGVVRLKEFSRESYPALCVAAWADPEVVRAGDAQAWRSRLRARIDDDWYGALEAQLKRLAALGARALIVDVGRNGGGDDSGDIATRLFTRKPLHSSPLLVSQSPTAAGYLDEQLDNLAQARGFGPDAQAIQVLDQQTERLRAARTDAREGRCDLSWVWRERRDWNGAHCRRLVEAGSAGGPLDNLPAGAYGNARVAKRLHWPIQMDDHWGAWDGPLYVLTDARTFSAAEMFAATLRNNGVARTLGQRTGGDGCGFMLSVEPLTLQRSRLRLRMPNCVRLRSDGSDEVAGIAPDLPLPPREGENARARAQRAIAAVVADWPARFGGAGR